jgi:hypothetical protein
VAAHLDGPLRVAIAGRVKAGKSTLLNALVGTRIAATDAGECTRVVTWYQHAAAASATAFGRVGPPAGLRLEHSERGWTLDLGGRAPEEVDRVEVGLPSPPLLTMTLIDTPGLGSLTESAGRRTEEFLDESGQVDAVLYLLRHLHASDVDFLDAFDDTAPGRSGPVHAVGVLSRADELGGGAPDALDHAARAAAGYRSDPRLRTLVYTVLPVAGLLAEAAAALTAADLADLLALADAGPAATAALVLSATRFALPYNAVPVPPAARRRLLGMLGLFGVRLCLALIRDGVRTPEALRAALHDRSGLTELRTLLLSQFAERRDVLKADGALRAVENVARLDPIPGAHRLLQEVERIRGGAHELAELRLLGELRLGAVPARPGQVADMERLLGGQGTAPATRLGLGPGSSPEAALTLLTGLHRDWTRVAQDRLTEPGLARAARVLQRTCEGLVAQVRGGAELVVSGSPVQGGAGLVASGAPVQGGAGLVASGSPVQGGADLAASGSPTGRETDRSPGESGPGYMGGPA